MRTIQNSNEKLIIENFSKNKVLTINELKILMPFSLRTIFSRLKMWNVINSYNKNGMYYTLTTIAKFDSYGLWQYNDICFSKHGNLKQTLLHLINSSEKGLNAVEISELLRMDCRSFLWQYSKIEEIQRTKIEGHYVWFSADAEKYQQQKAARLGVSSNKKLCKIRDSSGILILIERIKNPDADEIALSKILLKQGIKIKPEAISEFFDYHGIEKKNNVFN